LHTQNTDIKTHPLDMSRLLLAYEGGACLLDLKTRSVLRSFQLRLLPGAPGAGGAADDVLWTERASAATCVAWRSCGSVFAMGHADGVVSFWSADDGDKPLMVRTLDALDVERPQAPPAAEAPQRRFTREPIFKLAWSSFPAATWRDMASSAMQDSASSSAAASASSASTSKGTILTVLGGGILDVEPAGLANWHFPPYSAPLSLWASKAPDAVAKQRAALRKSLASDFETRLPTCGVCEDFLLLPRSSPHYGGTHDPTSILTLVGADERLPPLAGTSRGMQAFSFPPSPHAQAKPRTLPLALSLAGSGAVLGARLFSVSAHAYRRLLGAEGAARDGSIAAELAEAASAGEGTELPLRGGAAHPRTENGLSPELLARGSDDYRLMLTWHHDGTVRFADVSAHLLLVGRVVEDASAQGGSAATVPPAEPVLQQPFPRALPHLTISVRTLVLDSNDGGTFARLRSNVSRLGIVDVALAADALELAVVLAGGAVLHFRFGFARASHTEALRSEVAREVAQDEAAAREMAEPRSPSLRSPGTTHLDDAMSAAMRELGTGPPEPTARPLSAASQTLPSSGSRGALAAPPPRPRRDARRLMQPHTRESSAESGPSATAAVTGAMVRQVEPLGHFADWQTDGFKPTLMLDLVRGGVTATAVSDIGFLAVACGAALAVLDLRSAAIVYREGFGDASDTPQAPQGQRETRDFRKMQEEEGSGVITRMTITIARSADDPLLAPRLVVLRHGAVSVRTFVNLPTGWACLRTGVAATEELTAPVSLAVLDAKGIECSALPTDLRAALREQERPDEEDVARHESHLLLAAGGSHVVLRVGLTGARLAKADVGEPILQAQVVERHNERVCAVITPTSTRILSLPHLEPVARLHNKPRREASAAAQAPLSVSLLRTGDVLEVASSSDVRLSTLFGGLPRPAPPAIDLFDPKMAAAMPSHPGAVSAAVKGVTSWLSGKSSALDAGAQLDDLLAGPQRPARALKLPEPKHVQQALARELKSAEAEAAAQQAAASAAASSSRSPLREAESARVARQTGEAKGQAQANLAAAKERGEYMTSLEESLGSLEKGASKWLAE
jgi:hypothetical protein